MFEVIILKKVLILVSWLVFWISSGIYIFTHMESIKNGLFTFFVDIIVFLPLMFLMIFEKDGPVFLVLILFSVGQIIMQIIYFIINIKIFIFNFYNIISLCQNIAVFIGYCALIIYAILLIKDKNVLIFKNIAFCSILFLIASLLIISILDLTQNGIKITNVILDFLRTTSLNFVVMYYIYKFNSNELELFE